MAHNLTSQEIRRMYDLLYKYQHVIKHAEDKSQIVVDGLPEFLKANDVYINTPNKENISEANNHYGFFLYSNVNKDNKEYKLVYHLRNAFAHGNIHFDKKTNSVKFKIGPKTFIGAIPRELAVPFFELLHKINIKR